MAESQQSDLNLREFLTLRARAASDTRLALDVGLGSVIAIIALLWRGGGWNLIASAAICFASFGGWGIADRELREREPEAGTSMLSVRLLRSARVFAAALGGVAAGALLIGLLGITIGTWIS